MAEVFDENDIDNEIDDSDESDDTINISVQPPKAKTNTKAHLPVANAKEVPLFPDADKDLRNTIAYIKVIKQNNPKPGYRGQVPHNATLQSIGLKFGNGIYTIEGCAQDHSVLRREMNVEINLDEAENTPNKASASDFAVATAMRSMHEGHQKELDRHTKLTESTTKNEAERSREYTAMVRETSKENREAMQQFYQASAKNQQDFFGSIMAAQNMGFQQVMALMTQGHNMQLAMMQEAAKNNNPMVYVQMMMKGMEMGMGMADSDEPDYIKAMRAGGDMLSDLVNLAGSGKKLPSKIEDTDEEENDEPNPVTKKPPVPGTTKSGKKIFEKEEILGMMELKEILRSQGIDLAHFLEHAKSTYKNEVKDNEPSQSTNEESEKESSENG